MAEEEVKDIDLLIQVRRQLARNPSREEKTLLLRHLVELLKSPSMPIRRSAKYVLMWSFGFGKDKEHFSFGPPSEKEIRSWENIINFHTTLNKLSRVFEEIISPRRKYVFRFTYSGDMPETHTMSSLQKTPGPMTTGSEISSTAGCRENRLEKILGQSDRYNSNRLPKHISTNPINNIIFYY